MESRAIAGTEHSWFEIAKAKVVNWLLALNISWPMVVEVAVSGFIGFVAGILARKIGRHFVFIVIGSIIIALVLQYFNFITIEWLEIKRALGVQAHQTAGDVINYYTTILKKRLPSTIAALLGFLIGYRIG